MSITQNSDLVTLTLTINTPKVGNILYYEE